MTMQRHNLLWLVPTFLLACATSAETPPETLCDASTHIFCRCPGGQPGTKQCADDGQQFGECEPCDDVDDPYGTSGDSYQPPDPPSSGPSGSSSSSSGPGAGGGDPGPGAGGGPPINGNGGGDNNGPVDPNATVELLEACSSDGECKTGICRSGYCTQQCSVVSDCPYPKGECVKFDNTQTFCMPSCNSAVNCSAFGGTDSQCGYAVAIDNWDVNTCAHWAGKHQLIPNDRDCLPFDHSACNLGYAQREKVCSSDGKCTTGCFVDKDCEQGKTCSAEGGAQGECQSP